MVMVALFCCYGLQQQQHSAFAPVLNHAHSGGIEPGPSRLKARALMVLPGSLKVFSSKEPKFLLIFKINSK